MKKLRTILVAVLAVALVAPIALAFSACKKTTTAKSATQEEMYNALVSACKAMSEYKGGITETSVMTGTVRANTIITRDGESGVVAISQTIPAQSEALEQTYEIVYYAETVYTLDGEGNLQTNEANEQYRMTAKSFGDIADSFYLVNGNEESSSFAAWIEYLKANVDETFDGDATVEVSFKEVDGKYTVVVYMSALNAAYKKDFIRITAVFDAEKVYSATSEFSILDRDTFKSLEFSNSIEFTYSYDAEVCKDVVEASKDAIAEVKRAEEAARAEEENQQQEQDNQDQEQIVED